MKFCYKKRIFEVESKEVSVFSSGLTFRTRNTKNFHWDFREDVCHAFTSFFVFFDFVILWLDKDNNVLGYELVKPFRAIVKPKFKFRKVLELPVNERNKKILKFFVDKQTFK